MVKKTTRFDKQSGKNRRKNVSLKKIAGKVIDAVKNTLTRRSKDDTSGKKSKPFGGRGGRRRKPSAEEINRENTERQIEALENGPSEQAQDASTVFGSFFYTNEKFLN